MTRHWKWYIKKKSRGKIGYSIPWDYPGFKSFKVLFCFFFLPTLYRVKVFQSIRKENERKWNACNFLHKHMTWKLATLFCLYLFCWNLLSWTVLAEESIYIENYKVAKEKIIFIKWVKIASSNSWTRINSSWRIKHSSLEDVL